MNNAGRRARLFAGLVLFGTALTAQAIDYNFLDAQYLQSRADDSRVEASGYRATLSSPLDGANFLYLDYARTRADGGGRARNFSAGLGFHSSLSSGLDLVALTRYQRLRDASGQKDRGYSAELSLRWQLLSRLELEGGGQYLRLDRGGESELWFGGLLLHISPQIALSGRYENAQGEDRILAGLRFLSPP